MRYQIVDMSSITATTPNVFPQGKIEKIAKNILALGGENSTPVILLSLGLSANGPQFRLEGNDRQYWAMKEVAKSDRRKGEMINAMVCETQEELENALEAL
ncbi:hypothetical protein [Roseofilum capinflatum]|uniref:Uncharacterized protein n=1 Tax=Roseofilum capinflatum BLCC-M114 TaxID=3022440 RepID=A0ABT7B825_9CYAN|nr:hypothetical protein [Roseofilum capinflatum]MDJ1174696.1 hypothetical protein [Roseofilum capinflatum BLCC-M114]